MAKKVFTSESLALFVGKVKEYVQDVVSAKANVTHTHNVADVNNLQIALDSKASSSHAHNISDVSSLQNALDLKAGINHTHNYATVNHVHDYAASTHSHNDIYYTESEVDSKLSANLASSKTYADELNTAMDIRVDTMEGKLSSVSSGAEVNQNAFSNVIVGSITIAADSKADSLTLAAGTGISVAGDATNDKIAITNAGVRSVSTGSANGTISVNTNGTSANVSVKGLGSAAYTSSTAYDASGTAQAKADAALDSAKAYADDIKDDLLNGAGSAYDTLKELGDLIDTNADAIDALETIAASKANSGDLTSHISNKSNPHGVTLSQLGITATASELNKMDGITATTAELNLMDGVTATTAEINYLDGVTSGIQSQLDSLNSSKAPSSHNHSASNITSGTLPIARGGTGATTAAGVLTSLGVTATASELNKLDGITATTTELNYTDGVTSNIQTQINAKQPTITGGASTITSNNLTVSRALVSDGSGKVAVSDITSTELGYLDGIKSNIQAQIDGKAASGHTHSYAGSSSVGGAATSANKLNTNAGDTNTPVYFNNGVPVACTSLDLNTSGSSASCTGNAATATKLQTARTIGLSTGAVGTATSFNGGSNITIPVTQVNEAYLSWGGRNISGGVTPIDAAASNMHSANRFQFAKAAGITIEYSRDSGDTWTDYGASNAVKQNLVSGIGAGLYIGNRNTSTTVKDKLRITLDATSMGVYTRLLKLLINISTNYAGGSNVIVEKAMKGSTNTFSMVGTYTISGWSGWNSIPIGYAFGGGDTQTYNIAKLRLTFGITSVNSEQTSNALTITDIIGIGDTYWQFPSNMAKTGHLYSYDSSQNAIFPASISGAGSLSMGRKSGSTIGDGSVAVGYNTEATKMYSNAEGYVTVASGKYSHAEGQSTTASESASHAEGVNTTASGMYSHAEGANSVASGMQSHSEGANTIAASINQHVQGRYNISDNTQKYAHIVGNGDSDSSRSNAHTLDWDGNAWYAGDIYVGGTSQSNGTKLVKSTDIIPVANGGTGATTADVALANLGLTATAAELNYTDGVTSNIQTQLNGKSSTSHTHTADNLIQWADALFATSSNGGVEYSYGSNSGKDILTEISNMPSGMHTIYSIAGTTNNPNSTESWRMLVHKTSTTIGWVLAFDAQGSIYSNYQFAASTFKGWKCIYDAQPPILWMGEYWITDTQTVTPSKPLSQCRNGWVLVWSDYDTANEKASNGDCFTTVIPKWNPSHVKWSGQSFIAVIPTNLSDTGTVSFAGKRLYVHDTKITGNTVNDVAPSNDVCLRAIYEY